MYIKKEKRIAYVILPSLHIGKNKYNIWKKSCQYSISQDTEGGNSTCREISSRLAREPNPPHTQSFFRKNYL